MTKCLKKVSSGFFNAKGIAKTGETFFNAEGFF
jgi:hypothetical protein